MPRRSFLRSTNTSKPSPKPLPNGSSNPHSSNMHNPLLPLNGNSTSTTYAPNHDSLRLIHQAAPALLGTWSYTTRTTNSNISASYLSPTDVLSRVFSHLAIALKPTPATCGGNTAGVFDTIRHPTLQSNGAKAAPSFPTSSLRTASSCAPRPPPSTP